MELFMAITNIVGWLVIGGALMFGLWLLWATTVGNSKCRAHGTPNCGYCSYYGDEA
jgi:hypothetical protein